MRVGLSDDSEPVLSEGEVVVTTSREERTGVARQNGPGVWGALRQVQYILDCWYRPAHIDK